MLVCVHANARLALMLPCILQGQYENLDFHVKGPSKKGLKCIVWPTNLLGQPFLLTILVIVEAVVPAPAPPTPHPFLPC